MENTQQAHTERLLRWATYASVATAILLILAKLVAWFITDAVSLLATLVDSSLDLLASLINLVAVHHALQPADQEHRFGHGKAEPLAALTQSMFITGSAAMLLLQALNRLSDPQPLEQGLDFGLGVMVFSMAATLALVLFQKYVINKTNSTAIKADALHYKTDLLMNAGVIVALVLAMNGVDAADPIIGLIIAIFILHSVWHIVREAIDLLMDHEISEDDRQRIYAVASAHPNAIGMHDLRTRRAGSRIFIQFHLELNGAMSLSAAHDIAEELERQVIALFDDAEVLIHQDPVTITPESNEGMSN